MILHGPVRRLALVLLAGLAGCAPLVSEAPFPARPDTTEPGDLLGPFDGRAIDAASGKPISGAIVWASWGFDLGRGLTQPAGGDMLSVETDADGRYHVPTLPHVPRARERVARFTLVIYKRGYLAWRSDRRFDDDGLRHDFAQHYAVAKLDRFPAGGSHVKHVRYAGGGGALRRALAGEVVQASLELAGKLPTAESAAAAPIGPLLDASVLISDAELRAVTGYAGELEVGRLADLPQSPTYDSRHFRAVGKAESYDAAIRVWRPASIAAAEAQYASLLRSVPNVEERNEVGDRSLRGQDGKILAVATLDRLHRAVFQLTCGADQCRDHEQAAALLRRILGRAARLEPEAPSRRKGVEMKSDSDKSTEVKP